jgi:hypothetical protein
VNSTSVSVLRFENDVILFPLDVLIMQTVSVVWWSEFLATDPEVLGLIPGATRLSEK